MIYVLLVHDNSDTIESTRVFLERRGDVRVDVVHSTKQALERARSRRYDVIVSYHRIPEIDGIEFLADMTGVELQRELKSRIPATPFILYLREGQNALVLGDVNLAAEVPVRAGSPPRPVAELQDMIYQAVLRRKAERDQVLRADLLSAILSVTPLWLCQVASGKVDWVNSTMARALGTDAASLKGRDVADLFPGKEECDRAFREFALRADDKGWGHAESELVAKDGTLVPVPPADAAHGPGEPIPGPGHRRRGPDREEEAGKCHQGAGYPVQGVPRQREQPDRQARPARRRHVLQPPCPGLLRLLGGRDPREAAPGHPHPCRVAERRP